MSNYFTKNKSAIARVAANHYSSKTLIIIFIILSPFTFVLSLLAIIPLRMLRTLRKKIEPYELNKAYSEIIEQNHHQLNAYLGEKINDDDLIADPIFIFEAEITREQTIEKLKDVTTGTIDKGSILKYLDSNKTSWAFNFKDNARNFILASPFSITMLLFCEHNLIIVSKTCTLPLCTDTSLNIKEISYFKMNHQISGQKIVLGESIIRPVNIEIISKIDTILTTLKPYIGS